MKKISSYNIKEISSSHWQVMTIKKKIRGLLLIQYQFSELTLQELYGRQ